jgi:hypothetical protein
MSGVAAALRENPSEAVQLPPPQEHRNLANSYPDNFKEYLHTYVSPTFKSSPLFKPEVKPPLFREDHAYGLGKANYTNLPHLANHEASIVLPQPPTHPRSTSSNYRRCYPLNKKGNRNMGLEDRFENDPKMYWIWPKNHELLNPPPEVDPSTLPQEKIKENKQKTAWGTHIHEYAGIGGLSFLQQRAKCRDLDVARSHRHYLSGLSYSRHDTVTRSHITPFKKSLNRASDDLVPPANLIPLWKFPRLVEQCKFIKEDKYASHINKTEMFPLRGQEQILGHNSEAAIKDIAKQRYGGTTYSENFVDQRANTSLKLGPQFQFYDSEEDDGQENTVSGTTIEPNTSSTDNEIDQSTNDQTKGTEISEKSQNQLAESQDIVRSQDEDQTQTEDEAPSNLIKKDNENEALQASWPAWPGNRCNHIDPVTLKIAEKTDVSCLQDKVDVKSLKSSILLQQPDFKLMENTDTAPTAASEVTNFQHQFAPAYVDFAYSGVPAYYGCSDARANQIDVIDLQEKLMPQSRFKPIPNHLKENVHRFISRPQQQIPTFTGNDRNTNANGTNTSLQVQPSTNQSNSNISTTSSLDALQQTLNNLRQPTNTEYDPAISHRKRVKNKRSSSSAKPTIKRIKSVNFDSPEIPVVEQKPQSAPQTSLPPLWETLDYTSNRVVDQLGVRYKSVAQARYHGQYPESRSNKVSSPFANIYLRQDDRHTTYRRQYYNGHHMGWSFR